MNIKNTHKFLVLSAFFSLLVSHCAHATVIVTVSGQKIMMESETGKNIQIKLQEEQKKLTSQLMADEKKIQEQEQQLIAYKEALEKEFMALDQAMKKNAFSSEERDKKAEEMHAKSMNFEHKKMDLESAAQKLQADAKKVQQKLGEIQQKEMAKLDNSVKVAITELATKHKWDIVFMEESVVFANGALSKTDEVITVLDQKAKAAAQEKKQSLVNKAEKEITKVVDKVKTAL